MKILRQKHFTTQDRIAWEELKNTTNNFTTLPNGRGGMNARDVIRLKKWAELVDQGRMNEVEWNEAKKAFEHIGLPETANGLEHLSHKYKLIQDPKFQDRYNKIQSSRSQGGGIEIRPLLRDIGGYNTRKQAFNRDRRRLNRYLRNKHYHPGGNLDKFKNETINKWGIDIIPDKETIFYVTDPNRIHLSTTNPISALHEAGHQQTNKRGFRGMRNYKEYPISKLAEENMASSRAISRIRLGIKHGELNPKVEKTARKQMEAGLGTYVQNGLIRTLGGIRKIVRK